MWYISVLFLILIVTAKSQHMVDDEYHISDPPSTIAILCTSIGKEFNKKSWVKAAISNHKEYSIKHGYTYILRKIAQTNRHPEWEKIHMIQQIFNQTTINNTNINSRNISNIELILWMDADSIITNMNIKIENIIRPSKDLVIVGDSMIALSGNFIIRNSIWSIKALNDIWSMNITIGSGTDNAALISFLSGSKSYSSQRLLQYHYYAADIGWRQSFYKYKNIKGEGILGGLISPLHYKHVQMISKKSLCSFPPTYHYPGDFTEGDFILHVPAVSDSVRAQWIERRGELQYADLKPQCVL